MDLAPLLSLARLRRIERRQAELDLAHAARGVMEARLTQTAWENRIRQHATAEDPLALLAWLPTARAAVASARAEERAAECRREAAQRALAAALAAEDVVEQALAKRRAEDACEAMRRAVKESLPPQPALSGMLA